MRHTLSRPTGEPSPQERLDFAAECDRLARLAVEMGRGWLAYDLNCAAMEERVHLEHPTE